MDWRGYIVSHASVLAAAVGLTLISGATPQDPANAARDRMKAAYEAHKGEFDYLLGDWEFAGTSAEYGPYRGQWSAVRLPGGQILDEYRIVDDKGATVRLTMTIRAYNAATEQWELIGMDPGGGLQNTGTGTRVGDEMHIEQRFGVAIHRPFTLRIRYYAIAADRFSWSADRSTDEGRTWTNGFQRLEARRVGPAHSVESLKAVK